MSQTVRISKADLPSQIEISSVEIVDASLPQSVVKYQSGFNLNQFSLETSKPHLIPLKSNSGAYSKVNIEKVPVYLYGITPKAYVTTPTSRTLMVSSSNFTLNNNDTIRFSSAPTNAQKDFTYYVTNLNTSGGQHYFQIKDSENSSSVVNIQASTPYYKTDLPGSALNARPTEFKIRKVVDPNSRKKEIFGKAIKAFSGKYNVQGITNATYYEKNSEYITYILQASNPFTIFDKVTVSSMLNSSTFGATTIFNVLNAEIKSIINPIVNGIQYYTFTVKMNNKFNGYATSSTNNNARSLKSRPYVVIGIGSSNQLLLSTIENFDPDNSLTLPAVPTPIFTKSGITTGSTALYYEDPADRYYIKYFTKTAHHLIEGEPVNVYSIKPQILNIYNKTINKLKTPVTVNSFSFPITFNEAQKDSANLVYLFSQPTNEANREISSSTKYKSDGFLNNTRYFIKYRLVSTDNNLISKWSGIYLIENQHPETVSPLDYDGGSNG
jgi:hypothetical protein